MQAEVHHPTPAASHSLSSARIVRGGRGGQVHHKAKKRPNMSVHVLDQSRSANSSLQPQNMLFLEHQESKIRGPLILLSF